MLGLLAVLALPVLSYVNAANKGNRLEQGIEAQYQDNQNQLSNLTNQVLEAAQVPGMMKNDLKEVIKGAMEGRYGPDGVKGMLVSIQEAYPGQLDASLYVKIQNMIESGRNNFKNDQSKLIDKTRIYKTELGNVWGGFWLRTAGYPSADWDWDKYKPVVAERVREIFETGNDVHIKLN